MIFSIDAVFTAQRSKEWESIEGDAIGCIFAKNTMLINHK